jgi:acyl-coenzyme A synthetase/AMP-(fatty) acid ligase
VLNAYGLTETSDDTLHAMFHELPALDLPVMPIGRPVRHIHPYVLDEHLRLAPTGAPGEMAFSGVCVGRGYVNDPQRSAEVFLDDPFRPGVRMYRTGDIGRWLSDGSLEFLGRRDEQVKVNGYRVELGEVENRLLTIPGIAEAAVVVAGQSGDGRRLVGFYTGDPALTAAGLRDRLAESLPGYMIPAEWHRLDSLPLNENSKVDKRRLAGLAQEHGAAHTRRPLKSAREKAVAAAWAEVIGIDLDRIGREDDFFELGGTSLSAVRLVVRLGRGITLTEVIDCPVLHEMAALLEAG